MRFNEEYRKESEAETLREDKIKALAEKMTEAAEQSGRTEAPTVYETEAMEQATPISRKKIALRAGSFVAVAAALAVGIHFALPQLDRLRGESASSKVVESERGEGSSSMHSNSSSSNTDVPTDPGNTSFRPPSPEMSGKTEAEMCAVAQKFINDRMHFDADLADQSRNAHTRFSGLTKDDTAALKYLVQQTSWFITLENEQIAASGQEIAFAGGGIDWLEGWLRKKISPDITLPRDADYAQIASECAYLMYEPDRKVFSEVGDDMGYPSLYYQVQHVWEENGFYYVAAAPYMLGTDGNVSYYTIEENGRKNEVVGTYTYDDDLQAQLDFTKDITHNPDDFYGVFTLTTWAMDNADSAPLYLADFRRVPYAQVEAKKNALTDGEATKEFTGTLPDDLRTALDTYIDATEAYNRSLSEMETGRVLLAPQYTFYVPNTDAYEEMSKTAEKYVMEMYQLATTESKYTPYAQNYLCKTINCSDAFVGNGARWEAAMKQLYQDAKEKIKAESQNTISRAYAEQLHVAYGAMVLPLLEAVGSSEMAEKYIEEAKPIAELETYFASDATDTDTNTPGTTTAFWSSGHSANMGDWCEAYLQNLVRYGSFLPEQTDFTKPITTQDTELLCWALSRITELNESKLDIDKSVGGPYSIDELEQFLQTTVNKQIKLPRDADYKTLAAQVPSCDYRADGMYAVALPETMTTEPNAAGKRVTYSQTWLYCFDDYTLEGFTETPLSAEEAKTLAPGSSRYSVQGIPILVGAGADEGKLFDARTLAEIGSYDVHSENTALTIHNAQAITSRIQYTLVLGDYPGGNSAYKLYEHMNLNLPGGVMLLEDAKEISFTPATSAAK